jgi:methylmalonyl-CoA mutase, C-terminal domain
MRYILNKSIRVLIAKIGLDGHDRGAKVIAKALRDAGMEVIYTGLHQTAEMIAQAAQDEDVQVLGVSILSGSHKHQISALNDVLLSKNLQDLVIIVGGIIPKEDHQFLLDRNVDKIFNPGDSLSEIVMFIKSKITL